VPDSVSRAHLAFGSGVEGGGELVIGSVAAAPEKRGECGGGRSRPGRAARAAARGERAMVALAGVNEAVVQRWGAAPHGPLGFQLVAKSAWILSVSALLASCPFLHCVFAADEVEAEGSGLLASENGWFYRFFAKDRGSVAAGRPLWYLSGVIAEGGFFLVGARQGGVRVTFLVDSGAQVCLAPAEKRTLLRPSSARALQLVAFNGAITLATGAGELTFVFTKEGAAVTAEHILYRLPVAAPAALPQVNLALLGRNVQVRAKKRERAAVLNVGCVAEKQGAKASAVPQGVWLVHEGPAGGGLKRRGSACKPLRTEKELRERFNVTSVRDMSYFARGVAGVVKFKVPNHDLGDHVSREQSSRRRAVSGVRNALSAARPQTLEPGEAWSIDLTHRFDADPDGYCYGLVALDLKSFLVHVLYLKTKMAAEVVGALEKLRQRVAAEKRVTVRFFLGDNDTAWAVTGGGETRNTHVVETWLSSLPEGHEAAFRFAAPYTHEHVGVERGCFRLYSYMSMNLRRAWFTLKVWRDAMRAAVVQVNATLMPGSTTTTRFKAYYGYDYDMSLMIGRFGQTVYVHKDGKANTGIANATPGYFIAPSSTTSGWTVRTWCDRRCFDCYHLRIVEDSDTVAARLVLSDTMLAAGRGVLTASLRQVREQVRELFDVTGADRDALVRFDGFVDLPVDAFPAIEDGEPTSRVSWSEVTCASPTGAPQPSPARDPPINGRRGHLARGEDDGAERGAEIASAARDGGGGGEVVEGECMAAQPAARLTHSEASAAISQARQAGASLEWRQPNPKAALSKSHERYELYSRAKTFAEFDALAGEEYASAAARTMARKVLPGDLAHAVARHHCTFHRVRGQAHVPVHVVRADQPGPRDGLDEQLLDGAGGVVAAAAASSLGKGGVAQYVAMCKCCPGVAFTHAHVATSSHAAARDHVAMLKQQAGVRAAARRLADKHPQEARLARAVEGVTDTWGCSICEYAPQGPRALDLFLAHAKTKRHRVRVIMQRAGGRGGGKSSAVGPAAVAASKAATGASAGGARAGGRGGGKSSAAGPAAVAASKAATGAPAGGARAGGRGGGKSSAAGPAAVTASKAPIGASAGGARAGGSGGGTSSAAGPAAVAASKAAIGASVGGARAGGRGGGKSSAAGPAAVAASKAPIGASASGARAGGRGGGKSSAAEPAAAAGFWESSVSAVKAAEGCAGGGDLDGRMSSAAGVVAVAGRWNGVPCVHRSFWGCWASLCPRARFMAASKHTWRASLFRAVVEVSDVAVLLIGLLGASGRGSLAVVSKFCRLAAVSPHGVQACFVSGAAAMAREDRLGGNDGVYCEGIALERSDPVSAFPLPAGDGEQVDWIIARAADERRLRSIVGCGPEHEALLSVDGDSEAVGVSSFNAAEAAAERREKWSAFACGVAESDFRVLGPRRPISPALEGFLESGHEGAVVGSVGGVVDKVEYRSIPLAQLDPRSGTFDSGGLCQAVKSEIDRVVDQFKVMHLVSAAEVRDAVRCYGRGRVEMRKLVLLITMKRSATTGEETRPKGRLALADLVCLGEVKDKFSATVALGTVKFLANVTLGRGGRFYTLDVAGAYLHGKPLQPADGGRVIFVPVPPGFAQFGFPEFDSNGNRNYFAITGNLPGRQDAGLIWQECNDEFLRGFGFTQSEVDRRCFIFTDPISGGTIIICIHVDDSFIWCSDEVLWQRFFAAWSERFPPSEEGLKGALAVIAAEATQLEFCGLTFTINDEGSFEVSAGKLVRDLEAKLAVHGAPAGDFTTPMAADAIQALRAPPTETDCVLFDPALVESAMSIVGLGGWIVQACRADALLPFIALSQQLVVNFKKSTWRAVLRWGHYLVATAASKVMTFRPPPLGGCDWLASADSSCINALDEEGQ